MLNKKLLAIIAAQIFGSIGMQTIKFNGVFVVYLKELGIKSSLVFTISAIMEIVITLTLIPGALLSDRYGKKKIGYIGIFSGISGFIFILVSSLFEAGEAKLIIVCGIVIFGIGAALFTSQWFALIEPLIPFYRRGSFFGLLRFSWQTASVLYTAGFTVIISLTAGLLGFRIVFFMVTLLLIGRFLLYLNIPELENTASRENNFFRTLKNVLAARHVVPYVTYVFIIFLFTAASPQLFNLLEKEFLGFSNGLTVTFSNVTLVGSLIGFLLGGRLMDKTGRRPFFIFIHFAFPAVMISFLFRPGDRDALYAMYGILHFCYGFVYATASVTLTTEMLSLVKMESKALATAVVSTFQWAGIALSGFFVSGILELGLLKETWSFSGGLFSPYDSILLLYGSLLLILFVMLGLVPSVIHGREHDRKAYRERTRKS
ncbi:MAG: MFS transporter [Spirochaetia bacterium]